MKIINLLLFLIIPLLAFSQEVITTTGDYNKNTTGSLSWSIGEPVIETYAGTNNILTQGFQQSKLTVTSVEEQIKGEFMVKVYPNPARDIVHVRIDDQEEYNYRVKLYSIKGSILLEKQIKSNSFDINFSGLPAGSYFLKITNNSKKSNTYTIIKK